MCLANCDVIKRIACAWVNSPDAGGCGGICNVLCDCSPQLGGCLEVLTNAITFGVDVCFPANCVPWISNNAGGFQLNVPSGDEFLFSVNGLAQFTVLPTGAELANAKILQWDGNSNRGITNNGGGFDFKVETGDTYQFEVNSVAEFDADLCCSKVRIRNSWLFKTLPILSWLDIILDINYNSLYSSFSNIYTLIFMTILS